MAKSTTFLRYEDTGECYVKSSLQNNYSVNGSPHSVNGDDQFQTGNDKFLLPSSHKLQTSQPINIYGENCTSYIQAISAMKIYSRLCGNYTVSQKKGPTLKRYSSKLYGSILMIFDGNIQKSLE